ncbi:high-potential iron-sulfur protein [Haloferax namakaokahaiae]|uniref:High-potential iron-sulfur protein n=1 Tax=Haloferax namakaokahaiae TaxID=1748331 RepID=A0ABD5ZD25_9EURY
MARVGQTRRRFLQLAGSGAVVGIAGCLGGGNGGEQETETTAETTTTEQKEEGADHEQLPEGVSKEEFEYGPVPAVYQDARSQAGEPRVVEELVPKADVQFQEASEAAEAGLSVEGSSCENCAEFIPDMNGDGFGACAKVEGYIAADDWCSLWESIEEAEAEGTGETEGDENGSEIVYEM